MHRRLFTMLAAACAATAPGAIAAQQRFGPSVEASFGVFVGAGGTFASRSGPALDGIVAVPLGRTRAGTVVVGATAGLNGPLMAFRICGPDYPCDPTYPEFLTFGAVAGVQRAIGAGISARALAGPAHFKETYGDDAVGLQGRLDLAAPVFAGIHVVACARGSLLPSYQGETLSFATFGMGLRLQ